VPADGRAQAVIEAVVTLSGGAPASGRLIHLRPLDPAAGAQALDPVQAVPPNGELTFTVSGTRAGRVSFGLFDASRWSGDDPLATVEVELARKVVVLVPGFQSALARRYLTFGEPRDCAQPGDARSITEALMCLGYEPDVTILDMAWEAAPCRPADAAQSPPRTECVATIAPTNDGSDVRWQPAEYDLVDLGLSMLRQRQVDLWGHRLARTMVTYDEELLATTGTRASFYLVGHSLGGQVVVRALRAMLNDPDLRGRFEGENRGLLHTVVSVDGALNWDGTVALIGQPRCGMPVRTVADDARARDNADAVGAANQAFGTLTVAMTSATDPIVTPDVALLRNPPPSQGYVEAIYHEGMFDDGCSHSALLWPEPTGYPLRDVFEQHIGPAAAN
jgi:pimeloyl-ACP methyl ester carboxylesterase